MAKDKVQKFTITDYVEPEKVNPYAEAVQALADAGEGKALTITVPAEKATREKVIFQKAANAIDKTARVVEVAEADGDAKITFRLKDREKPRVGAGRKRKSDTVADVATDKA